MSDKSNISMMGDEPRDIRLTVTGAGNIASLLLWIDDGEGMPLANLRLSLEDARGLAARLLDALAASESVG